MAYNYGREKYKWNCMKNKEEKLLRELGVSETVIEELRDYDWQMFKKERTYYHWNLSEEELLQHQVNLRERPLENMQQFLDDLDNQELYRALSSLDEITLQIIFYRVQKYSYQEIEILTGIKESTLSVRMSRLRKKLKNLLK